MSYCDLHVHANTMHAEFCVKTVPNMAYTSNEQGAMKQTYYIAMTMHRAMKTAWSYVYREWDHSRVTTKKLGVFLQMYGTWATCMAVAYV